MAAAIEFNAKTTANQAVAYFADRIRGKTVIVTGPSKGGLGFETAKSICKELGNGIMIIAGRNISKLNEAKDEIQSQSPQSNVKILELDLSNQKQVRQAAADVMKDSEITNIDMACPYAKSIDGYESQFATNHLGHFLFTNLLMPKILASKEPRIVNVSSIGHRGGKIRFDDVNFAEGKEYGIWEAYGQAKMANVLFSQSLADKYGAKGLTAYSLHPGGIYTPLQKHFTKEMIASFREKTGAYNEDDTPNLSKGWKSLQEGSSTHIVAGFSAADSAPNGSYFVDCQIANDASNRDPISQDKETAKKLWKFSEKLVGVEFDENK